MHKLLIIIALLTFSISGFSQKVKIKDDITTVDGTPFLKVVTSLLDNTITISALNATQNEIFATYIDYNDPNKVTSSNPNGTVHWIELNFLTLDLKCEVDSQTKKILVKFIIKHKLYIDGFLNPDNAATLISKFGMRYTENCSNNAGVTVIINN